MKINRLYTLPEVTNPIDFTEGLNLIMGEKDDSSNKNNGVGKSLSIEFINFALLKKKSSSRVSLIPSDVFSKETYICLDFELNNSVYTIKRSLKESETPTIIENGKEMKFSKIEDATNFLTSKLFFEAEKFYPSFRSMMGPLIRDERSEFKNLINCYDTQERVPEDYAPHLYLLGIDIEIYENIKTHIKEMDEVKNDIKKIKENVVLLRQKDVEDSRSDLNELNNEVSLIESSIDRLENLAGYEVVRDDIIKLESRIEDLRRQKEIFRQKIAHLKPISQKANIDIKEISEFYEQIKNGLGVLISKDLKEVISFKDKIDEFQNQLINERLLFISNEINTINKDLAFFDNKYKENLLVLDQQGNLKNLKQTYAAFKEKSDQLSQLKSFIGRYDELEAEKQRLSSEKEFDLLRLQSIIQSQKIIIEHFEKTILNIHEFIQGNKQASFSLKKTQKKTDY